MGKLAELLNGSSTSHRRMRDPEFRQAQADGVRLPHVAPINALVDELRRAKALDMPYVAPACGGVDAELLIIARDPGRMTNAKMGGSGFLCHENDDNTARLLAELWDEAGIDPSRAMYWNAYPWYINRKPSSLELDNGVIALGQLLPLLRQLRVVVPMGTDANEGWRRFNERHRAVARRYEVRSTHHTSAQAFIGPRSLGTPEAIRAKRMAHLRSTFAWARGRMS